MKAENIRYSRLSPTTVRVFVTTFGAVWLTGALWMLIQYTKSTPLDLRTPNQTLLMQLHGAVAFLSLICLGTFATHIKQGLSIKVNKPSGITLSISMAVLIVTAWMLYYVGDDTLRNISSLAHILIGACFPALVLGHASRGIRLMQKQKN